MAYKLNKILTMDNIPSGLFKVGEKRKLKKNEILKMPNENFDGAYILLNGLAVIKITSNKGQQIIRFILKPPCMVCEVSAITDNKSLSFFQLLDDSEVLFVNKLELISLIKNDDEVFYYIFNSLHKKISFYLSQAEGVIFLPADVKVATIFYEFAMEFGELIENNHVKINFPLTHQLISDLIGVNKSSVFRSICKLVEDNIICTAGRTFIVRDLEVLKNYIDKYVE